MYVGWEPDSRSHCARLLAIPTRPNHAPNGHRMATVVGIRHTGSLRGCIVVFWDSFAPRPELVPEMGRGFSENARLIH